MCIFNSSNAQPDTPLNGFLVLIAVAHASDWLACICCTKFGVGRAMVLGSFQCRGVLLRWNLVGQGLAVLAAGAGRVGYFFKSRLSYLPFLMLHLLGDGRTF